MPFIQREVSPRIVRRKHVTQTKEFSTPQGEDADTQPEDNSERLDFNIVVF